MANCDRCGEPSGLWLNVCFKCRSLEAQEKFDDEEEMDDGECEGLGDQEES